MAKRYICHLFLAELPDGMIEVTYEEPADNVIARPVDLIGPEPLQVPDQPQTQYEHDAWLSSLLRPNGQYTMSFSHRAADLPPIEEVEVPESPPEGVSLDAGLEAYQRPGQCKTLLVVIKNTADVPVPKLSVHWVTRNETPQPMKVGSVAAAELGEKLRLSRPSSFTGTLRVGQEVPFLLDEWALHPLLGQVAALSPERYWITIASGGFEVLRIDGRVVGDFLENLEDKPVTYEFVPPEEADSRTEDPETLCKGFGQLKAQCPSLELFTITVPYTENSLEQRPLLNRILPFMEKVNGSEFEGKEPGTVMFVGANAGSNSPIAKLVFLYRPEGWNKEFREETGHQRFLPMDFTPLAAMRIKGWH
jgi:hypothetical protein